MAGAAADHAEDLRALYDGGGISGVLPTSSAAPAPLPSAPMPPMLGPAGDPDPAEQEPAKQAGGWWAAFKGAVKKLKREVLALHYATHDARLGVLPRLLAFLAIAYALSPLDLIPDFIPVLGLVDDVLILGALLFVAIRLIPHEVMEDARRRAEREPLRLHKNWGMAIVFFAMWDALLLALVWWLAALAAKAHPELDPYKVWVVVGVGVVAVVGELAWARAQWRKERRMAAVLTAAGTHADLQEALLQGGTEAVQAYLEP